MLTLVGLKKEADSCRQEVKGMSVAMEIKEFELEQLRQFKIRAKSDKGLYLLMHSKAIYILCV